MNVICDYCQSVAEKVSGKEVYPHRKDLFNKVFYQCIPCKARVGCHPGGDKPLGRLANEELRVAKSKAHAAFDPIWKTKRMSRKRAYKWLAECLGIEREDCHIGMFDVTECNRVVAACSD